MTTTEPAEQPEFERPVDLNDVRERDDEHNPAHPAPPAKDTDPGTPPPQPEPTD